VIFNIGPYTIFGGITQILDKTVRLHEYALTYSTACKNRRHVLLSIHSAFFSERTGRANMLPYSNAGLNA